MLDNFLTTFIAEKYGGIRRNLESLSKQKSLEFPRLSRIFKAFFFGAEGGIRILPKPLYISVFCVFDNFLTTFNGKRVVNFAFYVV